MSSNPESEHGLNDSQTHEEKQRINDPLKKKIYKPAQDKQLAKVQALESKLSSQLMMQNVGIDDTLDSFQEMKKTKLQLEAAKQTLQNIKNNAKYQQAHREKVKRKLNAIETSFESSPMRKAEVGRPQLEDTQPGLLETIKSIAIHGSAAHDRRRTEEIRSCRTLDDLCNLLNERGYHLSRSATYLRLMPRKSSSIEGRKHVRTVPVKLYKAKNDHHKAHTDHDFCLASIRSVESLASMLGPDQVGFISQDDKAKVPIGLTAAKKQSPLLMHVEYVVKLPDHDFVISARHKLIPSVYAGIVIEPNRFGSPDAVSYSGPTYISIRSGKHSSSTAATHASDFRRLLEIKEFDTIMKFNGVLKPVIIMTVDGGPDENPRFPKTITQAIQHFIEFGLDAFFAITNAPGWSCYNRSERRMAPLSKQLSGVILKHDYYGSHLNGSGKTIDAELEKRNFEHAGNTLAEIWNEMTIDDFPVKAEYKVDEILREECAPRNEEWYSQHVRESQYLLQIVKCRNEKCCGEFRSDLLKVLPDRFLPPPYPLAYKDGKIEIPRAAEMRTSKFLPLMQRLALKISPPNDRFLQLPYDLYCPSLQSDLVDRCCQTCGIYFASKKSASSHMQSLQHKMNWRQKRMHVASILAERDNELLCVLQNKESRDEPDLEWVESGEAEKFDNFWLAKDQLKSILAEGSSVPVIDSIKEWVSTPFLKKMRLSFLCQIFKTKNKFT
ncbi:hypothetical protein QAD02_002172 [Eretmocerus hayati]|uniref:Uncharacterized protein n=1 Tax=Eretmocerus hayati TaxID=131215 RepID=A0ACC2NIB1_9HYME|nr:hypothetical protein QAD02_002172 [Eretmocerus hayati]